MTLAHHPESQRSLSCHELRRLMPLLTGGDIADTDRDALDRQALDRHLAACDPCRERVEEDVRQQDLLRRHGRPEAHGVPDLWAGLRERLERPSWEGRWRPGRSK